MAKATTTSGEVDTGGLANIKTIIQNVASALNVNSNRYVTTAVCVVICDIIFTNISLETHTFKSLLIFFQHTSYSSIFNLFFLFVNIVSNINELFSCFYHQALNPLQVVIRVITDN